MNDDGEQKSFPKHNDSAWRMSRHENQAPSFMYQSSPIETHFKGCLLALNSLSIGANASKPQNDN